MEYQFELIAITNQPLRCGRCQSQLHRAEFDTEKQPPLIIAMCQQEWCRWRNIIGASIEPDAVTAASWAVPYKPGVGRE